jgi:glycosyltransferase involved in cell wall biosynthesis
MPYTLCRYHGRAVEAQLRRIQRDLTPDLVYIDHLHLAWAERVFTHSARVLREHNVEHLFLERYASSSRLPWVRQFVRAQARKMKEVERRLCNRMHRVLAIHEQEAKALRRISVTSQIEVIPVGIDFGRYASVEPRDSKTILLAASYAWKPNVEGAMRFLIEGWPWIRARMPEARLRVAGKDLPKELDRAARTSGAESVGYVSSMADEFARASMLMVPLWFGAGARVRIVEALASRLPVVSTPLGAEGLGLEPPTHIRLAETPADLAAAALDVLRHPERANQMALAGRARAMESFSIENVARRTVEVCRQAIAEHRAS